MDKNNSLPMVEVAENSKESGATMVEYALLVALIAIALIAVVVIMKNGVSGKFSQVSSALV